MASSLEGITCAVDGISGAFSSSLSPAARTAAAEAFARFAGAGAGIGTLIWAGVGAARDPQRFLQPGDEVTVEIEGIGKLTNPVVEEALADEDLEEEG